MRSTSLDLNTAIAHIQSNAESFVDVSEWLKNNAWVVIAAQLQQKELSWSDARKLAFAKRNAQFAFKSVTFTHEAQEIYPSKYYWKTDFNYSFTARDVEDRVDINHALKMLGFIRVGVGAENSSGNKVSGHQNLAALANAWHFIAEPCITEAIGYSFWNSEKCGSDRWYPHAELDSIALIQESLGLSAEDTRQLGLAKFNEIKNRSGHLVGPMEFCL